MNIHLDAFQLKACQQPQGKLRFQIKASNTTYAWDYMVCDPECLCWNEYTERTGSGRISSQEKKIV